MKLVSCKSVYDPHHHTSPLPPPRPHAVVYSTDRSYAMVPVLALLFVALWFILPGHLFYILPCVILFFSPSSSAIISLGEERAKLNAFHTFVRFALLCFGLFSLPLGGLGRVAVCDFGTPWTFLLPFFNQK